MMKISSGTSVNDEVLISPSGRVFKPHYSSLLKTIPPDLLEEIAKRRLDEIAEAEKKKEETCGKKETRPIYG